MAIFICISVAFWTNFGFTLLLIWAVIPSPPAIQTFPIHLSYQPYKPSRNGLTIKYAPPVIQADDEDDTPTDIAIGFADLQFNHTAFIPSAPKIKSRFWGDSTNAFDSIKGYPVEFVVQFESNYRGRQNYTSLLGTPATEPVDIRLTFYNNAGIKIAESSTAFFPQGAQVCAFEDRLSNLVKAFYQVIVHTILPESMYRNVLKATNHAYWTRETVIALNDADWIASLSDLKTSKYIRVRIQPGIPMRDVKLVVRIKLGNSLRDYFRYHRWIWSVLAALTFGTGAAGLALISTLIICLKQKESHFSSIKQE